MNFELSDEQRAIRDTARELLATRLPTEHLRVLQDAGRYDEELWDEVRGLGWTGIAVPEEHGGQGLGTVELVLLFEELGGALAPVPMLSNAAAGLLLAQAGSGEQQSALLPRIAAGELSAAVAWLRAGSAPLAVDAAGAEALVLVEGDSAWLAGDDTRVSAVASIDRSRFYATVLGGTGGDRLPGAVGPAVDRVEILLAAELTGIAQRALDLAVDYARERQQFGRPIGTFQAVSHRCARMLLDIEASRSLTLFAAWTADHEPDRLPLAASAAAVAAEAAARGATHGSMQVHGGIGFTWEHDLHLLLKRARASAQLIRSSREHHARIARLRRGALATGSAVSDATSAATV